MSTDNDDETDQNEFTYDTENDAGYRAWCIDSKKRWNLRKFCKKDTTESECVIKHVHMMRATTNAIKMA